MFDVAITRKATMKLRDGVTLALDLYQPASDGVALPGKWPVLVERTPYGRGLARLQAFGRAAAQRGYVFVCQDVRGRNDSEGLFEMMTGGHDEGADGYDTLAWIFDQPWCDGRIGSVGGSYSATNQQAAALEHPPGLRCQVLRDCGTNYYQRAFRVHGTFNVANTLTWVAQSALLGREALASAEVRQALVQMRDHLDEWVARLPIRRGASPIALSPEYEKFYFDMEQRSDDQPYWQSTGLRLAGRWDAYPRDVAPLLVTGWFATHVAANFEKFAELSRRLDRPVKLICGPWIHSPRMLQDTTAGAADFGAAAARLGPIDETWLRWCDRWVRDIPNGAEDDPAVRYFVMGLGDGRRTEAGLIFHGGEWRSAPAWPLPSTRFIPYYLGPDGELGTQAPAESTSPARYRFDPADACPGLGSTVAQLVEFDSFVMTGPRDQRCSPAFAACRGCDTPLRDRPDVLSFQTEPLTHAVEVTGPVVARLWVSTSAPDTDFTARLVDVYPASADHPEGCALLVTEGVVRMRYRGDRPVQSLLVPGELYAVDIELSPTSNHFKAGHRIRLDIASACFPQYDVNPNTGEPLGLHTRLEVAQQTVFRDARRPSHVLLPLQPVAGGAA